MEKFSKEEIEKFIKENEPHPLHDSARKNSLDDFIKEQSNESFTDMLIRLIKEKGMLEVAVYKAALITAQHFSKIRSERSYKPTKETVLALSIALKLNLPETKELMRAAGLAFTHANITDMIVEYYIINEQWDIFSINETLDAYNLKPLGLSKI